MVAQEMFKIVESAYGKVTSVIALILDRHILFSDGRQDPPCVQEGWGAHHQGAGGGHAAHIGQHQGDHHSHIRHKDIYCGQDYETGDNSDIIATDSQKNTVYVLAKQHGVASPEEFGLLLATHFVSKYPWVTRARVQVTAHPWQRIPDRWGIL